MSRDLNKAIPEMKNFALDLIPRAKSDLGLPVIVTNVDRVYEEQVAIYAQGRETLEETNRLRKIVNLPPITEGQNKNQVSWTMNSKHITKLPEFPLSRAIDFGILDSKGKYIGDLKADTNNDSKPDYIQLADLARVIIKEKGYKILPGADFKKNKDYPHYEYIG